jgi:hypothetical protein
MSLLAMNARKSRRMTLSALVTAVSALFRAVTELLLSCTFNRKHQFVPGSEEAAGEVTGLAVIVKYCYHVTVTHLLKFLCSHLYLGMRKINETYSRFGLNLTP